MEPTSGETYLAWNGEHYRWPPPEGWYRAADGRWWPQPNEQSSAPASEPPPAPAPSPTPAPPPQPMRRGRFDSVRTAATGAAQSAAGRATDAARTVAQSEAVQSAAGRATDAARTVAQSEAVQSATDRATDAARSVAQSEAVQSATDRASGAARSVQARGAHAVQAARSEGTKDKAGAAAQALGVTRGAAKPAPRWALVLSAVLAIVAAASVTTPWVALDFTNSGDELLGDSLPLSVVGSRLVRYSAVEMFGIGVGLAAASLAGAIALVWGAVRRARIWMLLGAALSGSGALAGLLLYALLRWAERAYTWLLPDDWSDRSPELLIKPASLAYIAASILLSAMAAYLFRRTRPVSGDVTTTADVAPVATS